MKAELSVGLSTTSWKPTFSDDCRYNGNKHTELDSGIPQSSQIKLAKIPMQYFDRGRGEGGTVTIEHK